MTRICRNDEQWRRESERERRTNIYIFIHTHSDRKRKRELYSRHSSKSIRRASEEKSDRRALIQRWGTRSGYYHGKCLSSSSLVFFETVFDVGNHLMNMMMRHSEWEWMEKWIFNFIVFACPFTHTSTDDDSTRSTDHLYQTIKQKWRDGRQLLTAHNERKETWRLFYYNHRSFIHMQSSNERMKWTHAWQINIYLYMRTVWWSRSINQLVFTLAFSLVGRTVDWQNGNDHMCNVCSFYDWKSHDHLRIMIIISVRQTLIYSIRRFQDVLLFAYIFV